jgi:hypothetical protein
MIMSPVEEQLHMQQQDQDQHEDQEQNLCILSLQIGSTFRRDGCTTFEVVSVDPVEHLVTCRSLDDQEWSTFYNFGGRHPFYENIRMNDVDRIVHPTSNHINNHIHIVNEVAFGSAEPPRAPRLTRGESLTTAMHNPILYNTFWNPDNLPELVDETAFLRVGYRFNITADGIIPYTITGVDGSPVHTIECVSRWGIIRTFRIKPYGKDGAELLQLRDIVELID